jgi:hypothetical protein
MIYIFDRFDPNKLFIVYAFLGFALSIEYTV